MMHFITSSDNTDTAVSAVRALGNACNYGGRVTDANDRRVLAALLDDYFQINPVQDVALEKMVEKETLFAENIQVT
jgi:hypothetical protein